MSVCTDWYLERRGGTCSRNAGTGFWAVAEEEEDQKLTDEPPA